MPFQRIINSINPRKLFLLDSIGAIVSAVMLGVVLVKYESIFGMPSNVLFYLAWAACLFSLYSFFCFFRFPNNWQPYMKTIGVVNLLYCCLTLGLVIYLYQKLTVLGLLYFVLEIIIVVTLATVEIGKSNPKS